MSINALGTESPAMKRRWADIGLVPRSPEPQLLSAAGREQLVRPSSNLLIAKERTKNNLVVAESSSRTTVVERVVISSYVETPAFLPTLERTLSEVEEESCDYSNTDESSDEDYDRFSSPRPAQPPEHAPTTRAKGGSALLPREILIRDDIAEKPLSEPFVLKQKIRKRQDGIDIRGADKTCRSHQGNDRIRRKKRRIKQSKTNSLEIILAVILAIITLVMEPTRNEAPTHIPSSNITFGSSNGTSLLTIERMTHSNDVLVIPANKSNELSRKTYERLLCKLLVKLRRKHQGLMKKETVEEKIDQTKQRINTIASSVGASALATLGAKIGSKIDIRLASVDIGSTASGTFVAKIQSILSRILPTFVTIGTAIGASIGAAVGIKVADAVLSHLARVREGNIRVDTHENNSTY